MLLETIAFVVVVVTIRQVLRLTNVNVGVIPLAVGLHFALGNDVNARHGVPASGVGIHSERVFRAGLAGDCVVCDFGHDVCGGDFILENVKVMASLPAVACDETGVTP